MKKLILTTLFAGLAMITFAAPSVLRKSGDCKVQIARMFDETEGSTATLSNEDVSAECKFRADDNFFGNYVVIANPSLDKAGELVCSASQGSDLRADAKGMQLASCLMQIPSEESAKIVSYKIVIYVSEAKKKDK